MPNDLVLPADLADFPGAPFSSQVIDAAVGNMRQVAGWHIGPSRTETIAVDHDGGARLVLNSLHVTDVSAVRDLISDTPLSGWRWSKSGVIAGCFPRGFQSVGVTLTHGYDRCPAELLPLLAAACQSASMDASVASQGVGPFSVTYRDASTGDVAPALARHSLPSRP